MRPFGVRWSSAAFGEFPGRPISECPAPRRRSSGFSLKIQDVLHLQDMCINRSVVSRLTDRQKQLSRPGTLKPQSAKTPDRPPGTQGIVLIDIGNTHTHLGFSRGRRILQTTDFRTEDWANDQNIARTRDWIGSTLKPNGACLCSVVPSATPAVQQALLELFGFNALQLTPDNIQGIGIEYPNPGSIGQDRLANAVAAKYHFGCPSVVVDFGTAVTFDVVNRQGNYVGGVIAPGLAAMTDYLHEKTALLPRIKIREPRSVIGKNTEEAMLVGAVHGYRGLVRELIRQLRQELEVDTMPVIATGGYAKLLARRISEITAVRPRLTLEGLRLTWAAQHQNSSKT